MDFFSEMDNFPRPIPVLDRDIPISKYCPLDLSISNTELNSINISNPEECQKYIDDVLFRNNAKVAYGGYLEKRGLYGRSKRFHKGELRNIHLGIDFWCDAGTRVLAPFDGVVHSFANNSDFGNYGPAIILKHKLRGTYFHTLYGHLSLDSLNQLKEGELISKGTSFAFLGTTDINVGYAPHLHFQLIWDLGNFYGDYPGVSSTKDLEFYKKNCPDPNLLLGFGR